MEEVIFLLKPLLSRLLENDTIDLQSFVNLMFFQRSCDKCQKFVGKERLSAMPLQLVLPEFPFSKWGLDFIGRYQSSVFSGTIFYLDNYILFYKMG
jgi:hypothetical protein